MIGSTARLKHLIVAACCLPLAACAAPAGIRPNQPHEVRAHALPPYQIHEDCVKLERGDRLEWSFEAKAPLDFNIHYHEGNTVILPVVREKVNRDEGIFAPLIAQEYCLMWEAGARGTPVDYRVLLIRKK